MARKVRQDNKPEKCPLEEYNDRNISADLPEWDIHANIIKKKKKKKKKKQD